MKFDLVDPPEDSDDTTLEFSSPAPPSTQEQDVPQAMPERGDGLLPPVRERMGTTVEGVRASLDRLRARVTDKNMTEAAHAAARVRDADAGTAFHPHRFTARTQAGER